MTVDSWTQDLMMNFMNLKMNLMMTKGMKRNSKSMNTRGNKSKKIFQNLELQKTLKVKKSSRSLKVKTQRKDQEMRISHQPVTTLEQNLLKHIGTGKRVEERNIKRQES